MREIGIVTPYGSQVRAIRRELGPGLRDVECQSVDGFQGREKTVIVFSAVRANHGGHVGFLADWCRTNVAVTRARNGLVVIGNEVGNHPYMLVPCARASSIAANAFL